MSVFGAITVNVTFNPSRIDRGMMKRLHETADQPFLREMAQHIQSARDNYQAEKESQLDAYELRRLSEHGQVPHRFAAVRYEMLPPTNDGPMQMPSASMDYALETVSNLVKPVAVRVVVPLDFGVWRLVGILGTGFVVTIENKNA